MRSILESVLVFSLQFYRWVVSPAKNALIGGPCCRFTPSCSSYALDAIRAHGPFRGSRMAVHRVCRCHPWSAGGHDPVPGTSFAAPSTSSR